MCNLLIGWHNAFLYRSVHHLDFLLFALFAYKCGHGFIVMFNNVYYVPCMPQGRPFHG